MSFIAMNRFKVRLGSEADFETVWKDRESRLKELPGFQEFRLLKAPKATTFVFIPVTSSGTVAAIRSLDQIGTVP